MRNKRRAAPPVSPPPRGGGRRKAAALGAPSIQQCGQRLRAPDVALLGALGPASQQDNKLATLLREVHAPSGPDMDAKLGDTVAHRLHVTEKTSLKPLDPRDHNALNSSVCQVVEPRGEFRQCFDAEHGQNVVDRLHIVKPLPPRPVSRKREVFSRVSSGASGFAAPNRPAVSKRSWPRRVGHASNRIQRLHR